MSSSNASSSSSSQLNASKVLVKDKISSSPSTSSKRSEKANSASIYQNRIGLLQHALSTKSNQVETLERRLTLVTNAIERLQVSNRDLLHQLTVLKNQSPFSHDDQEGKDFEIQTEIQRLELELQQSTQAYQSKLSNKQSKYRTLQSAYRNLEEQVSQLESKSSSSHDLITLLETKLEASEIEYQGLEIQSNQQADDMALLEQELDFLQANLDAATDAADTDKSPPQQDNDGGSVIVQQQLQALEVEHESLKDQLNGMQQKYTQSKQSFQELNNVYKQRRSDLTSLLASKQEMISTLEQSLSTSQKEKNQVKQQWKVATETIQSIQTQLEDLQQRFKTSQSKSQIDGKNARITNVVYQRSKEREDALERQVSSMACELDATRTENAALQELVANYQSQEKQQSSAASQWKQREDEWKTQIEGLYRQVAQLSNRCNGLNEERNAMSRSQIKERSDYEFKRAKEQIEWKNTLLNLKSDYEEVISGFQKEIGLLTTTTAAPTTETLDTNTVDSVTTSPDSDTTLLENVDPEMEKDMVLIMKTDDEKLTFSKRQRVRQFLRMRMQVAKGWCARSTKHVTDAF